MGNVIHLPNTASTYFEKIPLYQRGCSHLETHCLELSADQRIETATLQFEKIILHYGNQEIIIIK